jgi:hypothetical protein
MLLLHVNGTMIDERTVFVSSSSSSSSSSLLHVQVSFSWKVSQYGAHILTVSTTSSPSSPPTIPAAARVWIVPEYSPHTTAAPAFLFSPPVLHHGDTATFVAE